MVPKRVFWAGAGYAAGVGSSVWAYRKVRAALRRLTPGGLAERARDAAVDTGRRARVAIDEGRVAMRTREAELRHHLDPPAPGEVPLRLVGAPDVAITPAAPVRTRAIGPAANARSDGRGRRVR